MTPIRASGLGALAVIATAATAAASPATRPGRTIDPARERRGFMISVSVGPGAYYGAGDLGDFNGGGGMFSLRFGTRATKRLCWLLELDNGTFADEVGMVSDLQHLHTLQLIGVQWFPREVVWIRYAVGRAAFDQRKGREMVEEDELLDRAGLGSSLAFGYDVYRRGRFAITLELDLSSAIYRDSTMFHSGLGLGVSWY